MKINTPSHLMRRPLPSSLLPFSPSQKGFTLIELLIVIGIIGFLAAAVLVAVDPVKRIQDSRDARRLSEANAILNAILNRQVDERKIYNGHVTAPILTSAAFSQVIVTSDSGIECDVALSENFPGCNQALDTTTTGPSKRCVANLSHTGTGTGSAASSSVVLNGNLSLFTTQVSVGDTLTDVSSGGTCVVQSITNDLTIICMATPSPNFDNGEYTITHAAFSLAPNYIASIPTDPRGSTATICQSGCTTNGVGVTTLGATNTGYYIHRTAGNRIEIGACSGEQTTAISVKR